MAEETKVTQEYAEVLQSNVQTVRVTQEYVEVLSSAGLGIIVTQEYAEVLSAGTEPDPTPPTVASDTIDLIVYPSTRQDGSPPEWVSQRGSDVRCLDVTADRLVLGPAHPFADPDDCVIDNGLIRARFGSRDEVANMDVWAFKDDEWRSLGTVYFADPDSTSELMQRTRLVRLTPEIATVVVETRVAGGVSVTLKRGERMFRVVHGSFLEPKESRQRDVRWAESGGTLTNGLITGATTAQNLIRGVCVLEDDFSQSETDVGVRKTAEVIEAGVFVAVSGGTKDAAADHHNQYAGDCEQELRLRS